MYVIRVRVESEFLFIYRLLSVRIAYRHGFGTEKNVSAADDIARDENGNDSVSLSHVHRQEVKFECATAQIQAPHRSHPSGDIAKS